ncbi:unnamed protein product [Owenia fusiformis]|uniref:Uncharacterized protein n=1 Tax=Owenia fusiformis TaxID=6347 RepID=A0A8J1TPK6_OWEFU|nr:unnamed protein product [Owenia fusiformis]
MTYIIEMSILAFMSMSVAEVAAGSSCLQELENDIAAMKRDIEKLNAIAFPGVAKSECIGEFLVTSETHMIPDSSLTASTVHSAGHGTSKLRLGGTGYWAPKVNDENQWIQADLGEEMQVSGVVTQGAGRLPEWLKSYKIAYSQQGTQFTVVVKNGHKIFRGNKDASTPVLNMFSAVRARYIRIIPVVWQQHIVLRFDIIGCHD